MHQEYRTIILKDALRLEPFSGGTIIEIPAYKIENIPEKVWGKIANVGNKSQFRNFIVELEEDEFLGLKTLASSLGSIEDLKRKYSNIKAITLHAPHAYAICLGIKNFEYRSRDTNVRGWVLIHCGKSTNSDGSFETYGIDSDVDRGCIIGTAYLVDSKKVGISFEYALKKAILFKLDKPLYISGKQAVFWSPSDIKEKEVFEKALTLIPSL